MTDKVFTLSSEGARLRAPSPARLEKDVQRMFENNLDALLGLRLLASEFSSPCHTIRMDTLCLDANHCPVIVEYKLDTDSSVMNQGLFYLNWLVANKSVVQLLAQEIEGKEVSDKIDWSGARVVIVAGAYTRYDTQAVEQIQANLDLYTYKLYESGILILSQVAGQRRPDYRSATIEKKTRQKLNFDTALRHAPRVVQDRIARFITAIQDLSNDIIISDRDQYQVISAPSAGSSELGRMHLTETSYPKLRLEIFGSPEDFNLEPMMRTKKTRLGFEFSVTDDEYFDYAIEVIRQTYARSAAW